MPIAPLPKSLAAYLLQANEEPITDQPAQTIPEGERHEHMLAVAGGLRRRGASVETIRAALQSENETRFVPPLDDEWVEKVVASAMGWPPGAPGPQGIATGLPMTDEGNAKRFVGEYGREVRYDATRGWRLWDGRRWVLDIRGQVEWLARQTVSHIRFAADREPPGDSRAALQKWATKSEAGGRIDAMLKLARSTPEIVLTADDLDSDPYLLNCTNGVLDLRTGKLLPHDPMRAISKLCPWPYEEDAPPPTRWLSFLEKVLPDPAMREWLHLLFGYCLSGLTSDQAFWVLWGAGANGKSTTLDVLHGILGPDYAQVAPSTLLMEKRPGQATNDTATLHGARVVIHGDLPKGYLDTDLIKSLTGDAKVRARHLYAESFEFSPQCKLLISANTRPTMNESTEAVWRRLKLQPFDIRIAEAERILDYYKLLLAEEAVSILRWAVDGWGLYRKAGRVPEPQASKRAVDTYKADSDVLSQFIADACDTGDDLWCRFNDLLTAFHAWAVESGISTRRHNRNWLREEAPQHDLTIMPRDGTLQVRGVSLRTPGTNGRGLEID